MPRTKYFSEEYVLQRRCICQRIGEIAYVKGAVFIKTAPFYLLSFKEQKKRQLETVLR